MRNATRVAQLRCEYKESPLGIDEPRPRLGWQLVTGRPGARQTAWRVRASSHKGGRADLWDSGRVTGDQSTQVVYEGAPLRSRQRVWWTVEVWDEKRGRARSAESFWEMGLLEGADWKAQWIGSDMVGGPRSYTPAPHLRREFSLPSKPVSARLYVTALGLHECVINGTRVSDEVLSPGWTDFRKRVYYRVHDVARLLKAGRNAVGAILGSGWYSGHLSSDHRQNYGDRPRLLLQLEVRCADGSSHTIAGDREWLQAPGPILDEDLIMGESYDARRELGDWCVPGFAAANWRPVVVFPDPGIAVEAMPGNPMRRQQELAPIVKPIEMQSWRVKRFLFDLGQNMVGWIRLKVRAPAGTTIRIRYVEILRPDGEPYWQNLRTARAIDYYTCKGGGLEVWEPRFTFHGFRYVELLGLPETPGDDAVTGIVVHSDLDETGRFTCSDPKINQLARNIDWGLRGNFVDVPTDCPQRDERCGWTGDAQVFIRTATVNRDVAAFFSKWQRDLADSQYDSGSVAPYAPTWEKRMKDGGPAWADAIVICPSVIHERYGDLRLVERNFESFKRFMDYCEEHSIDGIRGHPRLKEWVGFGDWLALDGSGAVEGGTPKELIGTAFVVHCADLVANAARLLGKKRDVARFTKLAARTRRAFQREFLGGDGLIACGTQTAYVLALHFGIVPEKQNARFVAELVRLIEANGNKLATGFVGSPYLPHVLSANGRTEVAYRLLHQDDWPSWLYAVTRGATTIWERWDGWTHDKGFQDPQMNSFNHYAYGAIGEWLVGVVAGIDFDPARPGGKHLLIHPKPGGRLRSAKARLHTQFGNAESGWRLNGGTLRVKAVVPPNSAATITLPVNARGAVRVNGGPMRAMRHLKVVRRTESALVLEAGAGTWEISGEFAGVDAVTRARK